MANRHPKTAAAIQSIFNRRLCIPLDVCAHTANCSTLGTIAILIPPRRLVEVHAWNERALWPLAHLLESVSRSHLPAWACWPLPRSTLATKSCWSRSSFGAPQHSVQTLSRFPRLIDRATTWPVLAAAAASGVAQVFVLLSAFDRGRQLRTSQVLAESARWDELAQLGVPSPWTERAGLISLLLLPLSLAYVFAHDGRFASELSPDCTRWVSWTDGLTALCALGGLVLLIAAVALPWAWARRLELERWDGAGQAAVNGRCVENDPTYRSQTYDETGIRAWLMMPVPRARRWVLAVLACVAVVAVPVGIGIQLELASQIEAGRIQDGDWVGVLSLGRDALRLAFLMAGLGVVASTVLAARTLARRARIRRSLLPTGEAVAELVLEANRGRLQRCVRWKQPCFSLEHIPSKLTMRTRSRLMLGPSRVQTGLGRLGWLDPIEYRRRSGSTYRKEPWMV